MIGAILDQGRAAAEALMLDTCTITVPGAGDPVFNETTGAYTDPAPDTVWGTGVGDDDGRCEARIRNVAAQTPEYGGREVVTEQSVVAIPFSAPAIPPGATVTFTAVGSHSDPALVGTSFTVLGGGKGSRITARRLNVEEVTSG